MSRYDKLRETSQELTTIEGSIWKREYLEFTHSPTSLIISIRGFPPCPECQATLTKNYLEGGWLCPACKTEYDTPTLAEIILGGSHYGV